MSECHHLLEFRYLSLTRSHHKYRFLRHLQRPSFAKPKAPHSLPSLALLQPPRSSVGQVRPSTSERCLSRYRRCPVNNWLVIFANTDSETVARSRCGWFESVGASESQSCASPTRCYFVLVSLRPSQVRLTARVGLQLALSELSYKLHLHSRYSDSGLTHRAGP